MNRTGWAFGYRADRPADDRGLTLVELAVSVMILGLLSVVSVGLVYTVARSSVPAKAGLSQDNQVMFASTALSADVAGATAGSIQVNANAPACGSGAVLLQLVPSNPSDATVTAVFYSQSGTNLTRSECHGTTSTNQTLLTELSTTITPVCYNAASATSSTCGATTAAIDLSGTLSRAWQAGTKSRTFDFFVVRQTS